MWDLVPLQLGLEWIIDEFWRVEPQNCTPNFRVSLQF